MIPPAAPPTSRWAPLLIIAVTLLAMGRLCAADFSWWDDNYTLHQNPLMNPATWETVRYYWTHENMGLYVPITYTIWAGLAAIAHVPTPDDRNIALNPWIFHSFNIALHLINALLVYAILKFILRRPWPAAAGALLFAVHPVQVESVAWVSGMKDLLYTTFVLLTVYQYLFAVHRPTPRQHWTYWSALACTAIATLCKPTAVVTPVILAIVDLWIVGRDWRTVAKSVWPFALVVLPCVIWARAVQTVRPRDVVWVRPFIAGDALAFYLWKLVWPANLAVDYGHNPAYVLAHWWAFATWTIPAALAAFLWIGRKRRPLLLAGLAIFVAGTLPLLGFTPFMFQLASTTADHYLYLPMLGVALAAAWLVSRFPTRTTAIITSVIIATLATRSFLQAAYWSDDETLDRHCLAVNPLSNNMHVNLASALEFRARAEGSEALRDQAIAELREAIRIRPGDVMGHENLAYIMIERGQIDEAIRLLQKAMSNADALAPGERGRELAPSHRILGAVLAKRGRYAEAAWEFQKALEVDPNNRQLAAELANAQQKMRAAATRPATTKSTTTRP